MEWKKSGMGESGMEEEWESGRGAGTGAGGSGGRGRARSNEHCEASPGIHRSRRVKR